MTHQLGNTEILLENIIAVSDPVFTDKETACITCYYKEGSITAVIKCADDEMPVDHRINEKFEQRVNDHLIFFKNKWREAVKK